MKGLLTLVLLAAVCGTIFFLGTFRRPGDSKPLVHVAEELPLDVKVTKPVRREVVHVVQAPGDVEAVLEVDISSEIVAKIEEMYIEEGDRVVRGQRLCVLDDDDLLAEVESGEARVARLAAAITQAEAEFEKADRDMNRQIRLSENNATTVTEMADVQVALKRATAALAMRRQELIEANAFLKRVRENLKRTIIESPIAGVVSKLNAKQGEVVVTGTMNNPGTVIMSISDMSRMQVRARIDEIDVPRVRADQKARIYLQSDQARPVPARVIRVASKGSKQAGRDVVTFETLLEVIDDEGRARPGMTANVEIEVAHSADAVTVPIEAVVHRLRKELAPEILAEFDRRQQDFDLSERARQAQYIKVLYVMDQGVARIRLVDTGISDSRRVEIIDGVEADDEIIFGPYRSLDQIEDGRVVARLKDKDKEGAAEQAEPGGDDGQQAAQRDALQANDEG